MTERVGQFFGNYQLLRLLGRGAFAEVYLAEHRYLEVPAAIKVLHVRMETEAHEQFRREARTIAHLQHAHIIRVLDFGFQEQTPFLVMEYTPKGTLRTRHPKGTRLPMEQIIYYVKQIASALDYAHQQHVIHRDVKPENMLLSAKDEVVLSDFGLSVVQRSLDSLSTQNQAGTPRYMAPEQIRGKPTAASDQYALGVLVYEWLCGEPPFLGSLFEVLSQHLHQPPPSLCARIASLPPAVEDAVFGALAKEPQERFSSVQDFANVLEEVFDTTQSLSLGLSAERPVWEQHSPSDILSAPMQAFSTKEEERSSSGTQPLALIEQQTEETEELVASEVLPAATQMYAISQRESVPIPRTNRQRLLKKVRAYWIAGVFKHSLQGAALMSLGLHEQPDAVANPWQLVLQRPTGASRPLPAGTRIKEVYDAAEGELLILGAPGSGKTTLLLELARELLKRAEDDEQHPLPVVFNLSSWASKQQSLTAWLVEELTSTYQVPRKLGRTWVEGDQILPLLDGLDEVAPKDRTACIEAINTYRKEHGLLPLVVCSRSADYVEQSARVQLSSAVTVQPLTEQQVDDYLARGGEPLRALRAALQQDAALRELTNTPLMLNILTLTYHGMPVEDLVQGASFTDRQQQIFEHYVERMLRHRGAEMRYTQKQTTRWLSWLAWQMKQRNQTIFYIEQLQPTWLSGDWVRRAYDWLAVRFPAILMGALVILAIKSFLFLFLLLPYTLFPPLNIVLGGFIGWLLSSGSATQQTYQGRGRIRKGTRSRLVARLRIGVFIGLGTGLIAGLNDGLTYGLGDGLGVGLVNGLFFGLNSVLLQVVLDKSNKAASSFQPLQICRKFRRQHFINHIGIRNGIVVGLLLGLSIGLINGLLLGLGFGLSIGLSYGLSVGLLNGLSFGLSGGLLSALLIGKPFGISLTDQLIWSWRSLGSSLLAKRHVYTTLRVMVLIGLLVGLSNALGVGVNTGQYHFPHAGLSDALRLGLSNALSYGPLVGLSFWLLFGLFQGVASETIGDQHRIVPNQGIRRSAYNSLVLGLISAVIVWLSSGLSFGLSSGLNNWLSSGLNNWLSFGLSEALSYGQSVGPITGLSAGLLAGLLYGGLACLRHFVVRFLLRGAGSIPWNYPRFLDYAAERILLRKVGGGYIFVHRLLLEYFASLDGAPTLDEARAQEQRVLPVS